VTQQNANTTEYFFILIEATAPALDSFFIASDYSLKLYFFSLQDFGEYFRFYYLYLITVMKTYVILGVSNAAIRIITYK
jgi:hypothetical protein